MGHAPIAFISSTSEDLKQHREQASGFMPWMVEYFPADESPPSLAACVECIERTEVVIALVAHRYGWVPGDAENPDAAHWILSPCRCERYGAITVSG